MTPGEFSLDRIIEVLGLPEESRGWLQRIDRLPEPATTSGLPSPAESAGLLKRLGLSDEAAQEVVLGIDDLNRSPEALWLLDRCRRELVDGMGVIGGEWDWPHVKSSTDKLGRFFYVYVFLATLPDVRHYHLRRKIPDYVSWATLADLGARMQFYERAHDRAGFDEQFWLTLHFRGIIYRLGRLQFNRGILGPEVARDETLASKGFASESPALGTHIPEWGPLLSHLCDESLRKAAPFFGRHFPQEPYRLATCASWLLDDQLAEYLPATSNILQFQRRFHLTAEWREQDEETINFVFGKVMPPEELPRDTTLHRAIAEHILSGRHWRLRTGWLELPR